MVTITKESDKIINTVKASVLIPKIQPDSLNSSLSDVGNRIFRSQIKVKYNAYFEKNMSR